MENCTHLATVATLAPPRLSQSVHREECTQCFDSQDLPSGVDVCLTCFNGGCVDKERHHALDHYTKFNHPLALNIKRKLKVKPKRDDQEPPLKKLAIIEEREEDKYEYTYAFRCWGCGGVELTGLSEDPKGRALIDGIMSSMSSARQSEVKAWEEEILACEHTLTLDQSSSQHIEASGLAHCVKCDLKENLWLCMTCGSLGCGRQQFGGIGGNGHGLQHYEETRHPVSIKLGTITAEGTADIYCYECNDSKLDPELALHLASFGININTQTKTEKTVTELQIEQNLKFDFSLTGEDGKALEPIFGPGLTGLSNLGNSCYMASVIQTLFSLAPFQLRYQSDMATHSLTCSEESPAGCIECQMRKLADGLLSGRYSHPRTDPAPLPLPLPGTENQQLPTFQEGIKPAMLKHLIGKGHEEFSTMRQQDSEEFFTHLLKVLRQDARKRGYPVEHEPTGLFQFGMEQKLQCGECKRVRYRVDEHDTVSLAVPAKEKGKDADGKVEYASVDIAECLGMLTGVEALEYHCPGCQKNVYATKQYRFATFPDILVVHAKKFQLVNWVPQKLDIPVLLPSSDILLLDQYLGHGKQENEVELPEESAGAPALPPFDAAAMAQLEGMGFPTIRCQKALLATGNSNAEAAMEWLFGHMEDPDIDDPIVTSTQPAAGPEPSAEQVSMLADMGFSHAQARKALRETNGSAERAIEWLFSHPDDMGEEPAAAGAPVSAPKAAGSKTLPAQYRLKAFISHKGPSVHSGHYVTHIRKDAPDGSSQWVLFNDEKVVKADEESVKGLKPLAYLYFFERV
ncbi:hypothetical protein BOTBODRAFT_29107 [Botryobasidium botryosum FD-172 SS1]|uniref:Ubiquitin carboxyl-terminal hydrolase n=1 Tax=Botryobasidium botryosum (strain FD-172 SS1) TaxID=930990 RepID=A0A067N4N7_BOTB1|nr:hypothetical protein BOTBODRAFT_29107 [Botryobasidium botryosum FD-172 SS1]